MRRFMGKVMLESNRISKERRLSVSQGRDKQSKRGISENIDSASWKEHRKKIKKGEAIGV